MRAPEPTPAPVALFCYNRPQHVQRTVEALRLNAGASDTELYVFCDGPPDNSRRENTDAVRSYVRSIAGFKKVTIVERETNFGLSRSIVSGVDRQCARTRNCSRGRSSHITIFSPVHE